MSFVYQMAWRVAWVLVLFCVLFSVLSLDARRKVKRRQFIRTRCRNCGVDLRATPDRCPECGAMRGDEQVLN